LVCLLRHLYFLTALHLRENMTADLRYWPLGDRFPPSNRQADPPTCGGLPRRGLPRHRPGRLFPAHAFSSRHSSHLHQRFVRLHFGEIAASEPRTALSASPWGWFLLDLFSAPGALPVLRHHRNGSAAHLFSRSFLSNTNQHSGGQL
jgi:hypothetical protein